MLYSLWQASSTSLLFFVFVFVFVITFTFQLNSWEVFTLSDLLDKPWSQVSSLPPGTCLHFYRAQGSAFPLLVDSSIVAHSHSHFPLMNFYARNSPHEYVHSVRIEPTKLIFN